MVTVATVSTHAPWVRTPQQVIDSLFPATRPASGEAPPPPRPKNKRVWARHVQDRRARTAPVWPPARFYGLADFLSPCWADETAGDGPDGGAETAAVISTGDSRATVRVIRTDEDLMIARSVARILDAKV